MRIHFQDCLIFAGCNIYVGVVAQHFCQLDRCIQLVSAVNLAKFNMLRAESEYDVLALILLDPAAKLLLDVEHVVAEFDLALGNCAADDDLQQSSIVVPFADTLVAVMAAMATMPAVFSAGLDPGQGPGMIFVTLQTVFQAMGAAGPFFGFLFYVLVFIAAFTSCISVFEAVVSTVMDWHISRGDHPNRLRSVIIIGVISIIEATLVSLDGLGANGFPQFLGQGCWLDSFDLLAEGLMMPLGALLTAIVFGWIKPGWLDDEIEYGGQKFWMRGFYRFCIRFVAPVMMLLVLLGQINNFFGLGWF